MSTLFKLLFSNKDNKKILSPPSPKPSTSKNTIISPNNVNQQIKSQNVDQNNQTAPSDIKFDVKLQESDPITELTPTQIFKKYDITEFSQRLFLKRSTLGGGKLILLILTSNQFLGSFGLVHLYATKVETNIPHKLVAVKEFFNPNRKDMEELKIIKKCKHPNIVECFGCFQINGDIYIVLEFLDGGNLNEYLTDLNNVSFFVN